MHRSRTYLSSILGGTATLMVLAASAAPVAAKPGEFEAEVNFIVGLKSLDGEDWAPVEDQQMFAAEMSWGTTDFPVYFVSDVIGTATQEDTPSFDPLFGPFSVTTTGTTFEMDFGVRKIWEVGTFRPYLGGGVGIMIGYYKAEFLNYTSDDADATLGPWLGGGMYWRLGPHFNLGLSARWSQGIIDLFGANADTGGLQYGLLVGFGFPAK